MKLFGELITQISRIRWNFGRVTRLIACFSVKTQSIHEWKSCSNEHSFVETRLYRHIHSSNESTHEWVIRRMTTHSSNERLIRRMSMNKHCLFDDFTDWLIRQTHSSNDSMCSQRFSILHLNTKSFTKINLMTVAKTIFDFSILMILWKSFWLSSPS